MRAHASYDNFNNMSTKHEAFRRINRRHFLTGMIGAGATAALFVAGIEAESSRGNQKAESNIKTTSGSASQEQATSPNVTTQHGYVAGGEEVSTSSMIEARLKAAQKPNLYAAGGNPEELYQIAENGPEALIKRFQITREQAPTPELLAKEYAARLRDGLNLGCSPVEVAPFIQSQEGGYISQSADKYDLPTARGIYGFDPQTTDEEIMSTVCYQTFAAAHETSLTRYLASTSAGNPNQAISVDVINSDTIRKFDNGDCFVKINLKITDDYGNTSPIMKSYDIEAPITLSTTDPTNDGVLNISISNKDAAPLDQMVTQIRK